MDNNDFLALFGTTQCLIGLGCSVLNIIVIIVCAVVASGKNRSAFGWAVLGFFFSVLALFVLLLMPTVQRWPVPYPPPPMPYPPAPVLYAAPPVPPPYVPPAPMPYAPPPVPYAPAPPPPPTAPVYADVPAATMIQGGHRLTIVKGVDAGQSFALGAQARLGRNPDNEIRLNDSQASRYHALIQYQQSNYVIIDQGSGNGTYVNGQMINRPTPLSPGDVITIGNTQIKVS